MLGNSSFTGVQNLAAQLPELSVGSLTASNATILGIFRASDGSHLAPSYSFTDHTDSGMYYNSTALHPAGVTEGVAISTGGVNRFQIGGNGNASLTTGTLHIASGGISVTSGNVLLGSGNVNIASGQLNTTGGGTITSGKTGAVFGKGLIRASAQAPGHDWEDGHLGNSEALVFTATDFISGLSSRPNNITTINPAGFSLLVSENTQIVEYIAIKVIPKGFAITAFDTLTIWAEPNGGAWGGGNPRYEVQGQSLALTGNSTSTSTSTGVFVPTGDQPSILTHTLTGLPADLLIGNGRSQVVIIFKPLIALSGGVGGVMGARITMSRV